MALSTYSGSVTASMMAFETGFLKQIEKWIAMTTGIARPYQWSSSSECCSATVTTYLTVTASPLSLEFESESLFLRH
jgi:hypothetical protein